VRDIVAEPEYLDVRVGAGRTFEHDVARDRTVLAYVIEGSGTFGGDAGAHGDGTLVLFGEGDSVSMAAGAGGPMRLLLISGRPIGEPVAWGGPIVMNTEEELELAFREYREGTFIK
jgi:redox-sensitive bicupin YhaK (pirin superfamily)